MALSRVQSQAEAKEALDEMEALRKRAARQAAMHLNDDAEAPKVGVRVLPMGADKVGMGQHIAGIGDAHYEKGETFDLAEPIAKALEDRGFVEILP